MKQFLSILCQRRYLQRIVALYILTTFVILLYQYHANAPEELTVYNYGNIKWQDLIWEEEMDHDFYVNSYYEKRKTWNTSNLGSILFQNVPLSSYKENNKTFVILVWKYWSWLQNRHVRSFSGRINPLDSCSVKNCIFTGNETEIDNASAVVVHIQHGLIPTVNARRRDQRWVFLNDESPKNAFSMAKKRPNLSSWANVFNWSMTYRVDADIPVAYGRTVPLKEPITTDVIPEKIAELVPNWKTKRRDILASVLMSNCKVGFRMKFLKELQEHIQVDVHGQCSEDKKKSCPGHFKADCGSISDYLFYLVLENTQCRQYFTEKVFYNAYNKGAIPIILGPPPEDCERILPMNSYLHAENFESPKLLAEEIERISSNNESLLYYHRWRNHFKVVDEHGYFGTDSQHLCRVCEALNYNDINESIYDEDSLRLYLDPKLSCK